MTNTQIAVLPTELRDETAEVLKQGYRLARVVAVPDLDIKLRVEVRWDYYMAQSFAAVSVLSDELKWTHLASAPASEWYPGTKSVFKNGFSEADVARELGPVADRLIARAMTIMS
jgi:hypothetical protein